MYLFSEFLHLKTVKVLPIWSISWVFSEHSLSSTFWDILGSNSIYGPGGKEVVREAPEEKLYDMRQIPQVKSVCDFFSDGGRMNCFISLA